MAKRQFEFELYRLNVVTGDRSLFEQHLKPFDDDNDILRTLQQATKPALDETTAGKRTTYEWALRDYVEFKNPLGEELLLVGVTLARSITEKEGFVVTDEGIVLGSSEPEPPLAETIQLFIHLRRHLVAVERVSSIMTSRRWLHSLQDMLRKSSEELGYSSWMEFEPIPRKEEIFQTFASFSRLMRLRVRLRLPNPELSRFAEKLFHEMRDGGIQEYLQDMRNAKGLSLQPDRLPRASVEIAQAGYKSGPVRLEGFRENKRASVEVGTKTTRGSIDSIRDFVRGMGKNAKTKEAQTIVHALMEEIDRVAPPPGDTEE